MKIDSTSDFLYKHSVEKTMVPHQQIFDIYTKDMEKWLGILVCHKSEMPLRPNYEGSVLAVDFLEVSDKNKGTGTKILKFAKDYSEQIGCNGYITLKSDGSYTPERIPHIFYRKFGFSTLDKKTDRKLDRFIRQKQKATSKDFPSLLMHYPPLPKKAPILKRVLNKFFGRSI